MKKVVLFRLKFKYVWEELAFKTPSCRMCSTQNVVISGGQIQTSIPMKYFQAFSAALAANLGDSAEIDRMYLCFWTFGFAHSAGSDEFIMHKIQEVIIFALVVKKKVIFISFYIHQEDAYLIAKR